MARAAAAFLSIIVLAGLGWGAGGLSAVAPDNPPGTPSPAAEATPGAAPLTPGGSPSVAPIRRQGTGTITGAIHFAGTAPEPVVLQMGADPFCVTAHQGETVTAQQFVVNDNGTLRWVFVYVREATSGSLPAGAPAPVELDQVGCMYSPHVLGMQAGGTIKVVNSDHTLHNVNVQPKNNPGFNMAQPIPGMAIERSFPNPEVMIPVRCDVHPWMLAYVGVVAHPFFAVSGEDGSFTIANLPAGDYVVEAWHERLGTKTANVTVRAGESTTADFDFEADR